MPTYTWPPTGGGSGGVTTLNGESGAVVITSVDSSVTITASGQTVDLSVPAIAHGNLTDAGTDGIVITGGTGAVIGAGTSIAQHVADTTHNGYLSSTDWNTFNGKQAALTIGNLTDAGTDGITVTGGTGSVIGAGTSLSQHVADTTHNGYLSSTDWNTFHNGLVNANLIPVNSEMVYVDKGGNDSTGNGSQNNPYLTIGKALAVIIALGDSSSVKTYIVHINAGAYSETGLQIPTWTWLVGDAQQPTKIYDSSGAISLYGSQFTSGSQRIGISNINFVSGTGLTVDFQGAGGSGSNQVYLLNNQIVGTITLTGRGSDHVTGYNNQLFGAINEASMQSIWEGGYMNGAFTSTTVGGSVGGYSDVIQNVLCFSNVSFTSSGGSTSAPQMISSPVSGTLTVDQSTTALYADATSLFAATTSQTNGGVIEYADIATWIGYIPTTPGNWSPSPTTVLGALDQLGARAHGSGTVTTVSVVSANGLAGTVANATTTPAITLSTSITGILQGNGTAISAATTGNLTDAGTDGITITSGTGAVLGSGTSIAQHVADTTHNGYLSSTDWNTFNGKGSGSVTSVSLTVPAFLSVSGSPITTSGTLAVTLATETANTVFAGPASGSAATPTFRALNVADQTIAAQAISASAIDWSTGYVFTKSIGSTNTTFTFSNQLSGQTIVVRVTATTGTVTWPTVKWAGGTPPTQTASGTDVYTFVNDGTSIYGSAVQNLS